MGISRKRNPHAGGQWVMRPPWRLKRSSFSAWRWHQTLQNGAFFSAPQYWQAAAWRTRSRAAAGDFLMVAPSCPVVSAWIVCACVLPSWSGARLDAGIGAALVASSSVRVLLARHVLGWLTCGCVWLPASSRSA